MNEIKFYSGYVSRLPSELPDGSADNGGQQAGTQTCVCNNESSAGSGLKDCGYKGGEKQDLDIPGQITPHHVLDYYHHHPLSLSTEALPPKS